MSSVWPRFYTQNKSLWQRWASSECPDVKNYKWRLNPVWHGMLGLPIWQQWASKG